MTVSAYVKFTYNEYLALSEFLIKKNTNQELNDTLVEILDCFKLNRAISRHICRETDYSRKTFLRGDSMADAILESHLDKEEAIHKEFRKKYLKLKDKLGSNAIRIDYLELVLKKSYLAHHIDVEYLNTKQLSDSIKRKLYSTITEKGRIEKYIYKKILNKFKYEKIIKQYVVESDEYRDYRIDFYFIDCKVAVEIDEWGHQGYYGDDERQTFIESTLGCVFVRFNPFGGDESFNEFLERLKKVVEYQKRKYRYSFSDDCLRKLDEIAYSSNSTVEEIIESIINEAHSKMMLTNKKKQELG